MTPLLKYYLWYDDSGTVILPGQLSGNKELETTFFSYSEKCTTAPPPNKGTILAWVDILKAEVVEILETYPPDFLVPASTMQKIKEQNKILLNPNMKKKEISYPIPDDLFIDEKTWDFITTSIEVNKYPLLIGPKGCGKTQTAISLAEAMNLDFFPINCGSLFKPKQTLIGTTQAKEGTTYLINSEFLNYFTSEKPTLILLNEISRIPQGAANYLMTALDRKQNYMYVEDEGRRAYKGANVHFIADANFGFEYTDTRNLDGSFMDRFIKFMVDYLPEKEEIALIMQKVPGSSLSNITDLVKRANICRKNEQLRTAVSTRQLLDMAEYLRQGFLFYDVMEYIFKNLFINGSSDERETIEKMFSGIE